MKATFVRWVKENETDIVSFYFRPERPLKHIAGQFTQLELKSGARWFSVSSPPGDQLMSITTRLTGTPYKQELANLTSGATVDIAQPMGDFVLPLDTRPPILMVAAGIGITPFLSILKDCQMTGRRGDLNLIYALSTLADSLDLKPYAKALNTFITIEGPLTSPLILKNAQALNDPYIYISGPEPLVERLVAELKKAKVKESRLVADYFPGYQS